MLWIFGFTSTWFEGLLAFPLGMIWAQYRDRIDEKSNNVQVLLLLLSFVIFGVSFILNYVIQLEIISLLLKMLSSISFVIFVVQLLRWIPVSCKPTLYLGKISLEIYVFQGLLLWILRIDQVVTMSILMRLIISIAIFIGTIVIAALSNPIITKINKVISGTIKKEDK